MSDVKILTDGVWVPAFQTQGPTGDTGDTGDTGPAGDTIMPFSVGGAIVAQAFTFRLYATRAVTITSVRASVGTAPTGASIIVDINKNGTTIFTNQSNRPTITAGTNTAVSGTPDVVSLSIGDYLTVDIDQVGSTVAGADLTVQVVTV